MAWYAKQQSEGRSYSVVEIDNEDDEETPPFRDTRGGQSGSQGGSPATSGRLLLHRTGEGEFFQDPLV